MSHSCVLSGKKKVEKKALPRFEPEISDLQKLKEKKRKKERNGHCQDSNPELRCLSYLGGLCSTNYTTGQHSKLFQNLPFITKSVLYSGMRS